MLTDGKRCEDICKFAPPEKGKWPCEDCDIRYHDRAELKQKGGKSSKMNISELSYSELLALEKQIKNRKSELANNIPKVSLYENWKDHKWSKILIKRFPTDRYEIEKLPFTSTDSEIDPNLSHLAADSILRVSKAAITLCDIALNNYSIQSHRAGSDYRPIIRLNSGISRDIEEKYVEMYQELQNVFEKYAKGDESK